MPNERVRKLRQLMSKHNIESILIGSEHNRRYISGFTGSSGMVLITPKASILLTDFRYRTQAPQQAAGFQIVEHGATPLKDVHELLVKDKLTKLAFEQEHVTYGQFSAWSNTLVGIELVPSSSLVEELRIIKDQDELQTMEAAAKLADDTFAYIQHLIRPGIRESEIALEMEVFMRSHGATSSSFDTIVASGERSAMPHGVASEKIIGENEFVTLDFGAYYQGYCSDLTRTVVVGKPTEKHTEIYNIVLEAQLHALEHIKPGMSGREADALARGVIERYGYGDLFGHGTGHGLGMEIHEAPRLSKQSDTILTPGMIVTVEPGIYVPDFGGVRIEDDIFITETGIKILTSSPKDLITLG